MSGADLQAAAPPVAVAAARTSAAPGVLACVCGWLLLAATDMVLMLAGFHRFYGLVRGCPTLGTAPREARDVRVRTLCAAVDRAQSYYLKRAWCLQRSAAAVCLLRLRGVPADLVVGVQKIPFYAHAWAEVDGVVVNDSPSVKAMYPEIARC
ncbi:MAG TPA: lasso peptide biosynthesis B2 protein [Longimicrobium sp.]|jgi:hypothetical protein